MIYILCEDSTSCFDFITTIISRVLKPDSHTYKCLSFYGCANLKVCIDNLKNNLTIHYNIGPKTVNIPIYKGDILIFYVDKVTYKMAAQVQFITVMKKMGIYVYFVDWYCSDSMFFSYAPFDIDIKGMPGLHYLYYSFKKMLFAQDFKKYSLLQEEYPFLQNVNPEQAANIIFYRYYSKTCCISVKKKQYISLEEAKNKKIIIRGYYNNICNKAEYINYCLSMQKAGYCSYSGKISRGDTHNLREFYLQSNLSKKLVCLTKNSPDSSLHTILGIKL